MTHNPEARSTEAVRLTLAAAVTLLATVTAFAAFDDITTGNETDYTYEYIGLIGCALWLLFVSVRLLRTRHAMLGAISLVALAAAAWGQRAIRPGTTPSFEPHYVATGLAFAWALTLVALLLCRGWLPPPEREGQRG